MPAPAVGVQSARVSLQLQAHTAGLSQTEAHCCCLLKLMQSRGTSSLSLKCKERLCRCLLLLLLLLLTASAGSPTPPSPETLSKIGCPYFISCASMKAAGRCTRPLVPLARVIMQVCNHAVDNVRLDVFGAERCITACLRRLVCICVPTMQSNMYRQYMVCQPDEL